jgi:3-hydroxybutyrate dehydrogenase
MTKELLNKVAIVTGAGGGIGRAIAEKLAEKGANIVLADINLENAQNTAKIIEQNYAVNTLALSVNVADETQVIDGFQQIITTFGQIDILVNNAGIQIISSVAEFEFEQWKKVIDINLNGMFLMTKYALREMEKQHSGNIVYIGSVHSFEASKNKSAYVASKHATLGLMRSVAKEYADKNIRANLVAPGFVLTPLVEKQIPEQAKQLGITEEEVINNILLKNTVDNKFTTLAEVADAVYFFAATQNNSLTGQSLIVSHGWHMK